MAKKAVSSARLMIVENQHEITHLLKPTLQVSYGSVEVYRVPSGEEAYLFASFTRIDLLISEYHLPGISGIELMHKLRRLQPQIKVILVNTGSDADSTRAVTTAGADAFFLLPPQASEILSAVANLLALEPSAPIPASETPGEEESPPPTLASLLSDIRHQVKALALLLIDTNSAVLARAGDLPETESESALLTSLLSIHSAGGKVSHILQQNELSGWSVFDRGEHDLLFVPLDAQHALLALGPGLATENQLLQTVSSLRQSREPILSLLYENIEPLPAPETAPVDKTNAAVNGDLKNGNLESLLDQLDGAPHPGQADEFWEAAVRQHATSINPDTISYEQARQLGLAPAEDT